MGPKLGVAVIIRDGSCILLGRRLSEHGRGTYSVPGGHVELGEDPFDAARREVFEETGMNAGWLDFLGFTNDVFSNDKHYVTLFFEWRTAAGTPVNTEPDKCEGWEWYHDFDLPKDLFLPLKNFVDGQTTIVR